MSFDMHSSIRKAENVHHFTSVGALERPHSISEINHPVSSIDLNFIVIPSNLKETQILKKRLRYYSQLQNQGVCHFIQCFYSKHLLISNCVPCAAEGMSPRVENTLALTEFLVL